MATQGLVTVRVKGEVVMKIVTGCNGYVAGTLANFVRANWPLTMDQAYDAALKLDFGNKDNLVVVTPDNIRFDSTEKLGRLYRSTFNQVEFNPRWKSGIPEYVEVIDL